MSEPQRPPEGAMCAEHPDRLAQYVCPRCGSFACLLCFRPGLGRCEQCLTRDPAEAAAPMPWESGEGPALGRYLRTLGSALSPVRTAAAFAHGQTRSALRFALLSALPIAALAGVIPHTRTLLFAGDFAIKLIGKPSSEQIALDVAQAALLQVGLSLIDALCLLLPYVSLVRAYAPGKQGAAARAIGYRVWLLPASLLFVYFASWASHPPDLSLPAEAQSPPLAVLIAVLVRQLVVPVLLFISLSSAARLSCGLGPLMSLVVVAVAFAVLILGQALTGVAVSGLIPPPPQASSP